MEGLGKASRVLYFSFVACCVCFSGYSQTGYEFNWSVEGQVDNLAVQPDGKILVADPFSAERLNLDGTLDGSFQLIPNANAFLPTLIYCWAVQQDGKIVAGGEFNSIAGVARTNLCRMNQDGTVDTNFVASTDGDVFSIAVQPDGKLVVGGGFTLLDGRPRAGLGRLNGDGSVDETFNPGLQGVAFSLAVQEAGRIFVGGWFTTLAGTATTNLGRLMTDGKLDTNFLANGIGFVNCFAGQADGKLLVSESLGTGTLQLTNNLLRLNDDGTLDSTFNPQISGPVLSVAVQTDGELLIGGSFSKVDGQPSYGIGRLKPDGSLEPDFNPLAYEMVTALAVQKDGKILIGGLLRSADAATNSYVGRFENTGPAPEVLGLTGSTVTWLRGGTGPEVWYASFEHSTNGVDWSDLGLGSRIQGGWALSNVSLASGEILRANGYVSLGQFNGPNWFVSSQVTVGAPQLPAIITQPVGQTNYEGISTVFSIQAGLEPLSYQWLKNGTNLAAATNAILVLPNIALGDAGDYQVVVSNPHGSQTSAVAALTVNVRPAIEMRGFQLGQTAFWVTAQHCNRVILEASTDLHNWTGVQTNLVGVDVTAGFSLRDPASGGFRARFYRVRQE
jgi:uncharacterized delta-60 repeat protein